VLPDEFLQNEKISVDDNIKNFSKTLHVPTVSLPRHNSSPSCRASCHASSSLPPSSGSVGTVSSHLFSRSTTAPLVVLRRGPAPSPSESGPGMRSLPSAASRLAWPRTPRLAARVVAADHRVHTQAVLPQPSRSRFQTHWFLTFPSGAATIRSQNHFPTRRGGFCTPGTGGAITGAIDAVPVLSTGTVTEVGPLTSSPPGRGQSSGGALWTPAYTSGDGQTSRVFSNYPVLHLYISFYVTVNKPVLSCLLLHLLPQEHL
jgi:hypothetical protein